MNFDSLLQFAINQGASDIHLQAGSSPQLRIGGLLRNVEAPPLTAEALRPFLASIAPKSLAEDLDGALRKGVGFSTTIGTLGRFRCALYSHLGTPGVVLRVIPPTLKSIEELGLPPVVRDIALARRGLVLVTGQAGSGKTTTLAALLDLINQNCPVKMITIEDPVEVLHASKKGMITQSEVGVDVASLADGLSQAVRQDPDVLLVSDLRDEATTRLALRAAESGRQVLAAATAPDTILVMKRILAQVPPGEQSLVLSQLAAALEAVIGLRLVTTKDGTRRPAVEIVRGGPLISKSIQDNRLSDVWTFMGSRQGGMQQFDQHLTDLYREGRISGTETLRLATHPEVVATELRAMRQGRTD